VSDFDVVMRVGPAFVLKDGPKPRPPADRHGFVDVAGERIAVLVQCGHFWPPPAVVAAGTLLASEPPAPPSLVRTRFFGKDHNEHWHVVERPGGVALPALVRRVRKKDGMLPLSFAVRIARDVAAAHAWLDAHRVLRGAELADRINRSAALLPSVGDVVVMWDGSVTVTPRLFGSPADLPRWADDANDAAAVVASLLFALLVPLPDATDVDARVLALLRHHAAARANKTPPPSIAKSGAPDALQTLVHVGLSTSTERGRPLRAAEVCAQLDAVLDELGGDNERFAASMVEELYAGRKRADLEWREELAAAPLAEGPGDS
jgi:hypothetical protein